MANEISLARKAVTLADHALLLAAITAGKAELQPATESAYEDDEGPLLTIFTEIPSYIDVELDNFGCPILTPETRGALRTSLGLAPGVLLAGDDAQPLPAQPAREDGQKALRAAALEEAGNQISWAVNLLDMYDRFLVSLGHPPEKVYSATHAAGKKRARDVLASIRALAGSPAGEGREATCPDCGEKLETACISGVCIERALNEQAISEGREDKQEQQSGKGSK